MARARPGHRQVHVKMTLMVPKHPKITNEALAWYIDEAVRYWNGQFEPPSQVTGLPGDPMFGMMHEPEDVKLLIKGQLYHTLPKQDQDITLVDGDGSAQTVTIVGL